MPPSRWSQEDEVKLLVALLKAANVKLSQVDLAAVSVALGSKFTHEGIRQKYRRLLQEADAPASALLGAPLTPAAPAAPAKWPVGLNLSKKRKRTFAELAGTTVAKEAEATAVEGAVDEEAEGQAEGSAKKVKSTD